jgi:hypothetical protein
LDFEERTEQRLNNHSDRIRALETNDARQTIIIEELCKKMDSLINWIKALILAYATGTGLFYLAYTDPGDVNMTKYSKAIVALVVLLNGMFAAVTLYVFLRVG